MNVDPFIARWREIAARPDTSESGFAKQHFLELCEALEVERPGAAGYRFEQPVRKLGGGQGFADVWKRGCFGWEYKRPRSDLRRAYEQLVLYSRDLENPPLLIVCDLLRFAVYPNFNNTLPEPEVITLEQLADPEKAQMLRWAFTEPARLDPALKRQQVTEATSEKIGAVARRLTGRGLREREVAHFLMQVVFAFFAEDIGLLPDRVLTSTLEKAQDDPVRLQKLLGRLFDAMTHGGDFGPVPVPHFNGGLFEGSTPPLLEAVEADLLLEAARLDWSKVEPSIFGTLFERSLNPAKRSQLGAHYTSRQDIARVVEPVILEPLRAEWEAIRAGIQDFLEQPLGKQLSEDTSWRGRRRLGKGGRQQVDRYVAHVSRPIQGFLDKLHGVRVLDPACGSGNFLYVAMQGLLGLQAEVLNFAAEIGEPALQDFVSPRQFFGLEVDPFAHELASVVVWIGYLQWKAATGSPNWQVPILERLDTIQHRDALLNPDGTEAQWPEADYIVGNPPFLGDKKMRSELGDEYVDRLRRLFEGRVPGQADLVCYWFEKARAQIEAGKAKRAGLIATNSIRGGKNRVVLERIKSTGDIFTACSDEPWVLEGAAVRVSIVGFDDGSQGSRTLDGLEVHEINPDLSSAASLTTAGPLRENLGVIFQGLKLVGQFTVPDGVARSWLDQPNPDGVSNADVLRPYVNAKDLTQRSRGVWVIDFNQMPLEEASRYVLPFSYVKTHVLPERQKARRASTRSRWWIHGEARPGMRRALAPLGRYIATPQVSKHRVFVWLPTSVLVDGTNYAIARDDDFAFGVLHSKPHQLWGLRMGTSLEDRPRYTNTTCFETFPFPRPTSEQKAEIEKWAKYLDTVRSSLLASDPQATLTSLYNQLEVLRDSRAPSSPVYPLLIAHQKLDQAVAAAYGWEWPLSEEQILERLLALNLERAAAEGLAEPEREPA